MFRLIQFEISFSICRVNPSSFSTAKPGTASNTPSNSPDEPSVASTAESATVVPEIEHKSWRVLDNDAERAASSSAAGSDPWQAGEVQEAANPGRLARFVLRRSD